MNREDFNINSIYFDNAATTLKPRCVVDSINKYYLEHTSNIHRGDYDSATITNKLYDSVRDDVARFVNCSSSNVVFTSGTTFSINQIVSGYMYNHLNSGDEVILTTSEHASNILPWYRLKRDKGINIKFALLDDDYSLSVDSILNSITPNTRVISIAHVTNVIGDVRDIEKIGKICDEKNIIFCVDGAQSVPHMRVDFKKCNISFLSFSAHKMCGPTGVGVLVGKDELLKEMEPIVLGGGSNQDFSIDGSYTLYAAPTKFEAGTTPIAQVIGMGEAIRYLENIGIDKIHQYEVMLRNRLVDGLSKIDNIDILNKNSKSGIVSFNVNGVFPQEVSVYLNKKGISVRSGNHCCKILHNDINYKNSVRISLYFYNTIDEVDEVIRILSLKEDILSTII